MGQHHLAQVHRFAIFHETRSGKLDKVEVEGGDGEHVPRTGIHERRMRHSTVAMRFPKVVHHIFDSLAERFGLHETGRQKGGHRVRAEEEESGSHAGKNVGDVELKIRTRSESLLESCLR